MGKQDRNIKKESRSQFKQFLYMNEKLHEMLRSLGQEQVQNTYIKLDQFEKLRIKFVECSQKYEKTNNDLKFQPDKIERAKLVFELTSNKMEMQKDLKQMTSLVLKLNEKVKRQRMANEVSKTKYIQVSKDQLQPEKQLSPLQKQLQYKTLIVYTFEKTFFKLLGKQRKQVNQIKRDLNNKQYANLNDFLQQNPQINRLIQQQEQQNMQQLQILNALKKVDIMIEQRLDNLLDGIQLMNRNAINISNTLNQIHTKVIINLDKVQHNNQKLKDNQKRMDEASKNMTKPSCIMNVVIAVLLGLLAFLIVKVIWFSD